MLHLQFALLPLAFAVTEVEALGPLERYGALGIICALLLWNMFKEKKDLIARIRLLETNAVAASEKAFKEKQELTDKNVKERHALEVKHDNETRELANRVTAALEKLTAVLETRACLWNDEHVEKLIVKVTKELAATFIGLATVKEKGK